MKLPANILARGLVTMIGGYVLLKMTHFGRYTIAIGSNPAASEMTGVSVDRHKVDAAPQACR